VAISKDIQVLIVDDQQNMRRTIADILRAVGIKNLFYAENGKVAWETIEKQPIGLVILDWSMPVMTGIELLKKIRGDERLKHLPVLMVTAEAEEAKVKAAILSGVSNYVVKPFMPATLLKKVEAVLRMAVVPPPVVKTTPAPVLTQTADTAEAPPGQLVVETPFDPADRN